VPEEAVHRGDSPAGARILREEHPTRLQASVHHQVLIKIPLKALIIRVHKVHVNSTIFHRNINY
jgi:hypothetical protein